MKKISLVYCVCLYALFSIVLCGNAVAADFYWSGNSAVSDDINQADNWWAAATPASGDNLYFNNTGSRFFPYCNYGGGSWFGNVITYDGGGAITWKGDTTWAYKFESDAANNDLFTIEASIGNRDPSDLEINPVGSGGIKITGNVNIGTNDKWLKVYGSSQLEITGVISGNTGVDMTIFNSPTVILSGANTFPDQLNIYGGIVDLRNADTLAASGINLGESSGTQSATVQIGASGVTVDNNITVVSGSTGTKYIKNNVADSGTYSGAVTLNDNVTLSAVSGSTLTMSGIISGAGKSITLNDVGTVVLSGVNTFGGDGGQVAVGGGNLKISADNNLGADPTSVDTNYITLDNWGVLWATETLTLNSYKGIELHAGNGKIYVDATKTMNFSGEIVGGYEFSKDGAGILEMGSSSDIIASQVYIDAGTLWVRNTQPFDGTAATINLGATAGTEPAILKLGTASTTKSMDESVTVRAGSTGAKTIANGNTDGNCNFNGKIYLNDNLTVDATSGSIIVMGGGVDMSTTGDQNLTITGTDDVTISGSIEADTGAAELNHDGIGVLLLSGDNATAVDNQMKINIGGGGTLQVTSVNSFGDIPGGLYSDKVNFHTSGGVISNTSDINLDSNIGMTIADGVTATFQAGDSSLDDFIINGIVSDGGSNNGQVKMTGLGALQLLGINTYGGPTTVESGTVRIIADSGLGTAPGVETDSQLVLNGGALRADVTLALDVNRNIELGANGGSLVTLSGKTLTVNSKIKGTGNLTKSSAGSVVLAGVNSFTGLTTVDGGILKISADDGLGTAPGVATVGHITLDGGSLQATATFTLDSNRGIALGVGDGTIVVDGARTLTYGGIIDGGNALTKSGAGTLILSGVNTYNGATTVSSGSMIVNGSAASSAFTVDAGTTLMGAGTVGDTIINGTVNPGNNAVGELTVGTLTINNGAVFTCELGDCSGTTDRDFITDNGTATINATVTIDLNSSLVSNWDSTAARSWIIISGGISSTANFTLDETNWLLAKDGGVFTLIASGNNLVLDYAPAATIPVIDTPTVTDITPSSATLGATLQANGNATVTDYGIVWGTATAPTTADNKVQKSTTEPAMPSIYTISAAGLTAPQTLIYYRGYAINSEGTNYSAEDSFYTLSAEPAAQVTGFTTTNYDGTVETRLELSWTEVATADGYIILRSTTATPDGTPVDGTAYLADDVLGNGVVATVISGSATVTYQNNGLTAGTHYYYKILPFGYNGANAGTYNYLTSGTPATDDTWTLENAPTISPSGVNFTSVGATSMTVNWTKAADSDYTLVVMSTSSVITNPKNRREYVVSTVYGSGETTGINDYTIYSGAGATVAVTGLNPETTYYVEIFSFNGADPLAYQYNTTPGTGSQITTAVPTDNGTIFKFK